MFPPLEIVSGLLPCCGLDCLEIIHLRIVQQFQAATEIEEIEGGAEGGAHPLSQSEVLPDHTLHPAIRGRELRCRELDGFYKIDEIVSSLKGARPHLGVMMKMLSSQGVSLEID